MQRRLIASLLGMLALVAPAAADDGAKLVTVDHYVGVKSSVPAIAGQRTEIFVRERALAGAIARGPGDKVVLFVHGAGTPAEVSFDVPYADYSWMGYVANAGYDVFAMDMTGYGRSTRPGPMNDPCNLSAEQQKQFGASHCAAAGGQLTTLASDWDDLDATVRYVRALRHVDRIALVAWSLGGPRAAGYAARHPDLISKLVLLAPAYSRQAPATQPPPSGAAMNTQSRAEFYANWDRQVGCPGQYEPTVAEAIWSDMLASDPVGASWGTGVRRAPNTAVFGWTQDVVKTMRVPVLMVSGAYDKQVDTQRVRDFYADLGSQQKVFVDLACSSHNAMWEKNHTLLFRASLEWLDKGTVNGQSNAMLKLGY